MIDMKKERIYGIILTIFVWILIIVYLTPIIWMVSTSFKSLEEWMSPHFFPKNPTIESYAKLITGATYGVKGAFPSIVPYLLNSIIVAIITALVSTFSGAMVAYAIQRYRIGGLSLANWILSLRMIPPIAVLLPLVIMMRTIGLFNTVIALILVYQLITLPITTWFMIGIFKNIPKEIDEAALIDGCSELEVFMKVALPLAAPGVAISAIFAFIFSWNEFLIALVLATGPRAQTLPVYAGLFVTEYGVLWGPLAATGVITAIPVIIFALMLQKYIIRGLTLGAIKG